eukprot:GHUV01013790.1.p1 GENE.GHUV01013790.1~~GHUV01013790.1.p1  ORF type:complete len:1035 (+),score=287.38 GHUV01013790.1:628-3732(+)
MNRQPSGPHLGLEPGLGYTTPLPGDQKHMNHHHQQQQQPSAESTPRHPDAFAVAPITPTAAAAAAAVSPAVADEAAAAAAARAAVQEYAAESAAAVDVGSAAAPAAAGAGKKGRSTLRTDVLYGIINAVVGIPTMISFAAIVYQDATYKPYLGQLARMSFFSAAIHQLVFTIWSSLPFAVGQPQDVGLIFLSAMATSIAEIGHDVGMEVHEIIGTALLTLTVATAVVGIMTMLVARFKLATLVQYVPLPVVGGYLGYVGYFCLAAGIGLGCNTTINTFTSWGNLLHKDALIKFIPTFLAALVLWVCMTRARSPWALPATLAAVPAAFHAYLLITGTTLEQAQDAGWVLKPQGKATEQFWELYKLFNIQDWRLDGIYFPALIRQIPKMLGLFFVVTFGSCLDVAAIQVDMPFPIDFNGELGTVGLSNVIVGLSGSGYTGSYIFSQTIFSMRAGVSGWTHGAVIFALEAVIFLVPYQVVQYLPNFFFGALLTVFGIEIAGDWLIRSYAKVTRAEYLLLWGTFIAIMELELEMGVATGMLLCIIFFTVTYAKANLAAFTVLPSRSAAVRSYQESHILEALSGRLATVALKGFMFFGSSVALSDKVIKLAEALVEGQGQHIAAVQQQGLENGSSSAADGAAAGAGGGGGLSKEHARAAVVAGGPTRVVEDQSAKELRLATLAAAGSQPLSENAFAAAAQGVDQERLALLERQAPAFVILDFRQVLGIDATAAQTLASLAMVLRRLGVELIMTRVTNRSIRRLLVAHKIISAKDLGGSDAAGLSGSGSVTQGTQNNTSSNPRDLEEPLIQQQQQPEEDAEDDYGYCRVFETLNEGAKYAEDRLLAMAQSAGLLQDSLTGLTLHQFFSMHCSQALLTAGVDVEQIVAEVQKLGVERHIAPGQRLFSFGEVPETFYLILRGVVVIQVKSLNPPPTNFRQLPAQLDVFEIERCFSSGQGAVVGITDFVLQRPRSFQADATSDCVVYEITRSALEVMVAEVPAVATAVQVGYRQQVLIHLESSSCVKASAFYTFMRCSMLSLV